MKINLMLKSILIPTLGISTIGSIAAVSTSCGEKKPTVISVTGVELNKTSTTLAVGETDTLTATVMPTDATDKTCTWTSSNSSVATVDSNGTITPVSEGTATITVKTNDGGKTATCEVTVDNTIHVTSVSLNKSETTLDIGETETLTATVLPETATDKSVAWTSSDTNVATVNNGTITAKGLGNATITVMTFDGSKTATCEVAVFDQEMLDQCVTITANANSTLTLRNNGGNNPNLQYSTDGANWTTYDGIPIIINQGQNLYLKGNNPNGWSSSASVYSTLLITGNVSIFGNVMGLLDDGAKPGERLDITDIPCDYCFYNLFKSSTGITSVSEVFLPATTLADHCYDSMFNVCSSLTTAPDLPATNLAIYCYDSMFKFCSSLTTAPDLLATTLADYCYIFMFQYCRSLEGIKIAYTGNYSADYFDNWVDGIAPSGIFYYNGSQNAQNFQLPSGWTTKSF